jgi:hypothetical protein
MLPADDLTTHALRPPAMLEIPMRMIVPLLLAFTTLFPARTTSQALAPTGLVSRWTGSGSFFNRDLRAKVDPVPFVAEFTAKGAGTGRVGQAILQDARVVRSTRDYVEVRAKLSGFIGLDPALAKDRLVLVITKLEATTIQAEFHLKSNFTFDPRMREGRVTLTRDR